MSELLAKISIRLECNHASGKKIDHIMFMMFLILSMLLPGVCEDTRLNEMLHVAFTVGETK